MKKILIFGAVLFCLSLLVAGPLSAAGGTGPSDALLPVGEAQTIAPHTAQWYYFDVGGGRGQAIAAIDDNGASSIRLAIYTPLEITAWQNGNPLTAIGAGGALKDHDLGWAGTINNIPGRYYAVVSNDNDTPVSVSLRVTGDRVTTSVDIVPTPTPFVNPFATVTPLSKGFAGKLVFMDGSGGNIYTVNGDGTGLQKVTTGLDPAWNHSGTLIAFARQGDAGGIFTINADGSNERRLYNNNETRAPQWSPDDSLLLFSIMNQSTAKEFCFRNHCFTRNSDVTWKMATVATADGTYQDRVATQHAFTPTWSNDGNTIAYNDPAIGMMQTSLQGNYDPFNFIGDRRYPSKDYDPLVLMSPQYSPDGKYIVYMVWQDPVWQIAIANADGSNQHLLTQQDPLDFVHPDNASPTWSPDGTQIMFLSNRNNKKWEFFTMNLDGSNQQQVLKSVTDQITINYQFESERQMSWAR